MTSLDYLSEAYRLDLRIDSKLEQIASLNELAEKCSSSITGMSMVWSAAWLQP